MTVAGSDKQNSAVGIMGKQKFYQDFPITFSFIIRQNSNVFKLIYTIGFFGYYTLSFYTIVIQNKHFAAFEVFIYHVFLFVSQQQQVNIIFFSA